MSHFFIIVCSEEVVFLNHHQSTLAVLLLDKATFIVEIRNFLFRPAARLRPCGFFINYDNSLFSANAASCGFVLEYKINNSLAVAARLAAFYSNST
jgi:hypothetical protein